MDHDVDAGDSFVDDRRVEAVADDPAQRAAARRVGDQVESAELVSQRRGARGRVLVRWSRQRR
ncbi:hypothetical protein [Aeromicrobium sp. UC242_57]|uniref:hypothetical protein n=1 Tax=Aeromicrobium sp. UC242_57 TaxID=3374624 RepID=UPI003796FDE2